MDTYDPHAIGVIDKPSLDTQTITGLFRSETQLNKTLTELRSAGYTDEQVSVIQQESDQSLPQGSHVNKSLVRRNLNTIIAVVAGAALLALLGVALPDIGFVQVTGVGVLIILGAFLGLIVGGMFTFFSYNTNQQKAANKAPMSQTPVLVVVKVPSDQKLTSARTILNNNGGENVTRFAPSL